MSAVPHQIQARAGSLLDPFWMKMKIGVYVGAFFSLPFVCQQAYAFVRPALRKKEDQSVRLYLWGGFILLIGAIAFTHTILPHLINALHAFIPQTRDVLIQADIADYIQHILTFYLGFSILFQVPLVVFLSIAQEFVEAKVYTENRKWVVVILLVLCAIFSPPDVQSMFVLFLPLYSLFEMSVLLGRWKKRYVRS